MQLRQLLEVLPSARVQGAVDLQIGGIECDSRRLSGGEIFVAIRGGEEQDRHRFIPDALARGAAVIVAEEEVDTGVATRVLVEDCRAALAKLAARFYAHPDHELVTVGITGTNGKTTTSLLTRQVLEAAGVKCGLVGTLGRVVDRELQAGANTTPEASELHRVLRTMVDAGCGGVVLEVSSHALALDRVGEIGFQVGVFTNLTRDHLDFHRTAEDYFNAKARLFESLSDTPGGTAVINSDDPAAPALARRVDGPLLRFACDSAAEVRLVAARASDRGTDLDVQTPSGKMTVSTRLTGGFNRYNVLAAVASGLALELDPAAIVAGIAAVDTVPGRFERIALGQPFEVIVDYAHTPDSLQNVLRAARELTRGSLICAFGCGGDRDRGKRPLMGRAAADLADVACVTSDNPRTERPEAIIDEIVTGIERRDGIRIVPDRREAIRNVLAAAAPGDVVVLAGKGHEAGQDLGDRVIPFDDRQVAREELRELGHGGGSGEG